MKITKKMTFEEVINKYPKTIETMFKYGLHCVGCHLAGSETIEQGAKAHGLKEKDIKKMLEEMNKKIK